MLSWTWHGKLGGVRLLRFLDTSLRCRDTTEDNLSIFRVRKWTRHGKLGGVRLLRIFDRSLRCRDMIARAFPAIARDRPPLPAIAFVVLLPLWVRVLNPNLG